MLAHPRRHHHAAGGGGEERLGRAARRADRGGSRSRPAGRRRPGSASWRRPARRAEIVERLHEEIATAVRQPAMAALHAKSGARLVGNSPQEFAARSAPSAPSGARSSRRRRSRPSRSPRWCFPRRRGVDRERMHAAGKLGRERRVDHAVALEPALSAEGLRHDIDPEMGLAARPVAGMAGVLMGFVDHVAGFRARKPWSTFLVMRSWIAHGPGFRRAAGAPVNRAATRIRRCQDLQARRRVPHNDRS